MKAPISFRRAGTTGVVMFVALAGLDCRTADAATMFESTVGVTATLSLGGGAPVSGIGFKSGSNTYNGGAEVSVPNGFKISAFTQTVTREVGPLVPYDEVEKNGGLASLLFNDENGSSSYPVVQSSSNNGTSSASGTPSGTGLSFSMNSIVSGEAFHDVGYAFAKLTWTVETLFTNLTEAPLTVTWAVNFDLFSRAAVDHEQYDEAVVETQFFAGIGADYECCDFETNPLAVVATAPADPFAKNGPFFPNPPRLKDNKDYTVVLGPGAESKFSILIQQSGSARVAHPPLVPEVPLPATVWLSFSALGVLGAAARRRMA